MKLAEKLKTMSEKVQTTKESVVDEIVNFFSEKFVSGEMMETFERNLSKEDIYKRKKDVFLDFWTYIPGCSETYFELLGKKWIPEDNHGYEHKGIDLKNIYKIVFAKIFEITKANFEQEGFEINIRRNENSKRYETYIIEISW